MLHLPHVLPRVWADTYRQGLVTLRKHTIVPDRLSSRELWLPRCLCQCGKTPRMPRLQKAGRKPRKSSNFVNLARCIVRSNGNSWRTNMKAKSTENTKIRMLHVQIEVRQKLFNHRSETTSCTRIFRLVTTWKHRQPLQEMQWNGTISSSLGRGFLNDEFAQRWQQKCRKISGVNI